MRSSKTISTAISTVYRYDPQGQVDTSSTSGTTKGCAEVRLRTLRSANCIVSRPASAHRQLIIESMKFVDRQRQTGLSLAEVLIAVLDRKSTRLNSSHVEISY